MATADQNKKKKPTKSAKKKETKGQGVKSKTAAKSTDRPDLSEQQRAQLAQQIDRARDMVLARFAQVTISFMGVPRYAHQSIKDLQALAMIPLMRERVAIATVAPKSEESNDDNATAGAGSLTNPLLGMALWANVSEEVDAKIREQAKAGIFPVKLNPEDWTSGDIVWLLDVIAPSQKLSAQVLAAFKQVLAEKLPDRKSNDVKLHPIIKKMIGEEVLMQMGAREVSSAHPAPDAGSSESIAPKGRKMSVARGKSSGKTNPEVKTTIGKPRKKTTPGAKKKAVKSKKKVN